jgi:hypothetical protein
MTPAVEPIGRRYVFLALTATALGLAGAQSAGAASFTLGEPERVDALRTGQKSVTSDEFGAEWRTRDESGQTITVMTPYHRLALASRNATFKKEALKPRDIDSLLKESQGKLALWVTLLGGRADFARFFAPVLVGGSAEVQPSFVQNERTALRDEAGRYAARCLYVFPADGVDPRGRVTLVVRDPDSKEMAKFTLDLSAMR